MLRRHGAATAALLAIASYGSSGGALAAQLLAGTLADDTPFAMFGESREDVLGGEMVLGERRFTITGTSRMGLIGASRLVRATAEGPVQYGEYAVFSSSFSEQTAVGDPWAAAAEYRACDTAYNSFLAVYRVDGEAAVAALADSPYRVLTEDASRSDAAVVHCFMTRPATP